MGANFQGLQFNDIRPDVDLGSNKSLKVKFLKGLPDLPRPLIHNVVASKGMPKTDLLTDLKKLRTEKGAPTGKGTLVVLIDTGVAKSKLLKGTVLDRLHANQRVGSSKSKGDVDDLYGHGTHLAGIIIGERGPSMGIAPEADLISIKVTTGKGGGGRWSAVFRALKMVLDHVEVTTKLSKSVPFERKPDVVNLSFNGRDYMTDKMLYSNHMIISAIKKIQEHGVAVVISTGNNFEQRSAEGSGYPAGKHIGFQVGASVNFDFGVPKSKMDALAIYSQRHYSAADSRGEVREAITSTNGMLIAPGFVSVSASTSNSINKKYSITTGTSVSAAVVSGFILLLQQAAMDKISRKLTLAEVFQCLAFGAELRQNSVNRDSGTAAAAAVPSASAPIVFDNKFYCRVNIKKALEKLPTV